MSRSAVPIVLLAAVLAAVAGLQYWHRVGRTGYPAPDFTLADLQGTPYRLADFRGKVVFLNLWATWCAPCQAEMPAMETLYRRLRGRDFVMLAVSQDAEGAAAVGPFVRQHQLTFPVLLDPDARLSPRYGVTGYPETFIIDRSGQVVEHFIGPAEWDSAQMAQYFDQLLAEPSEQARS